jgi:hypothetical protein
MSNDRDDAPGRQETGPSGHGRPGHGQPAFGQQPTYDQPPYDQPAYGQPLYGPPGYGQPGFGQGPYGQPSYAPQHGVGPYGPDLSQQPLPARPGAVITAAVLGLVHGALGLLVTVGLLVGGAFFDDLVDSLAAADPSIDADATASGVDSVRAAFVLLAVLALAWTVVMVWGSVLALRGRSRVLLVVGSSIAVAATGLLFLVGLVSAVGTDAQGETGGVLFLLVLLLAALAVLVLICLRSAGRFFTAHRQRRALTRR